MNLEFEGIDNCNLQTSINYLQTEKKFKFILVEMGALTLYPFYLKENPLDNPVDTLFLSLFIGKVINRVNIYIDGQLVQRSSFSSNRRIS